MYTICPVCHTEPHALELNTLPLLQCPRCTLMWRREFTLPSGHYEQKAVDVKEGKSEARLRDAKGRLSLVKHMHLSGGLCDIGCGEGVFLKVARDIDIAPLLGVDPAEDAVALAVREGLPVVKGDVENLPKLLSGFPLKGATLFHVIEHLKDPLQALRAIHSSLPKGGTLLIETPNMNAYTLRKTAYRNSLIYPEHFFYFTEEALSRILQEAGFVVLEHGWRSFDEACMPIRESLFRLGFPLSPSDTGDWTRRMGGKENPIFSDTSEKIRFSFLRSVVRGILACLVRFLGRGDYQWIIAKK